MSKYGGPVSEGVYTTRLASVGPPQQRARARTTHSVSPESWRAVQSWKIRRRPHHSRFVVQRVCYGTCRIDCCTAFADDERCAGSASKSARAYWSSATATSAAARMPGRSSAASRLRHGIGSIRVDSAGFIGPGRRPPSCAREVARERGIDPRWPHIEGRLAAHHHGRPTSSSL